MNNLNNSLGENPTQKLVRRLQENKNSLHIARIPEKTRKVFIAIADEEFCSDYGFLLKFLVDKVISQDNKALLERIDSHESRISSLEDNSDKPTKKMLNGTKFTGGRK